MPFKHFIFFVLLFLPTLYLAQDDDQRGDYAKHLYDNAEFQNAVDYCSECIKESKYNFQCYHIRALSRIELDDFKGALQDFNVILKANPENDLVLANRGQLFYELEQFENAILDLEALKDKGEMDPHLLFLCGNSKLILRQYEGAILDFTELIEIDPNSILPYMHRSESYNFSGDIKSSVKDLEKVLELDPSNVWGKNNLAFSYVVLENYKLANILYTDLYQINSDDPYLMSNFGYVKHKLGKTEEGLNLLNESLKMMPENSYAYMYLAEVYVDLDDNKKACKAIKKGLDLGFTEDYGDALIQLKNQNCK